MLRLLNTFFNWKLDHRICSNVAHVDIMTILIERYVLFQEMPSGLIGPVGPRVTSPAVQEQYHVRDHVTIIIQHAMRRIALGQTKK